MGVRESGGGGCGRAVTGASKIDSIAPWSALINCTARHMVRCVGLELHVCRSFTSKYSQGLASVSGKMLILTPLRTASPWPLGLHVQDHTDSGMACPSPRTDGDGAR
jgi:hypothetical protein